MKAEGFDNKAPVRYFATSDELACECDWPPEFAFVSKADYDKLAAMTDKFADFVSRCEAWFARYEDRGHQNKANELVREYRAIR